MTRVPGTFKNRPGPLRPIPVPAPVRELHRGRGARDVAAFRMDECSIIVCREPIGVKGALRWHLSIAHPSRYPTWDEIKNARYQLVPDRATMAMLLPPEAEYVNLPAQDNVFHLHELEPGVEVGH